MRPGLLPANSFRGCARNIPMPIETCRSCSPKSCSYSRALQIYTAVLVSAPDCNKSAYCDNRNRLGFHSNYRIRFLFTQRSRVVIHDAVLLRFAIAHLQIDLQCKWWRDCCPRAQCERQLDRGNRMRHPCPMLRLRWNFRLVPVAAPMQAYLPRPPNP